jgi:hypothetical protein
MSSHAREKIRKTLNIHKLSVLFLDFPFPIRTDILTPWNAVLKGVMSNKRQTISYRIYESKERAIVPSS